MVPQAVDLATLFLVQNAMLAHAAQDEWHIAIAAVHGVDILLSRQFKRVADPVIQAKLAGRFGSVGMALPFICPPD